MKQRKIVSFFAGVGGIDLAFEQLNSYKVIYANEFDKNARKTFEANFDIKVDPRDIREIKTEEIPKSDILLAGFPCQAFSVAGYRKGFEDDRGDLFFETLKVIVKNKPEVVFLENVKNMVTHDEGNTFKVIRQGLEQNGYYLKWAVLNAKDYANIPQNRERIYIVAFRSKLAFDNFEFPTPISLRKELNEVINFKDKVNDKYYYTAEKHPTFYKELKEAIKSQQTVYQWRRQYVRENKSGVVPTLTANMGTGGHNVPLILSDTGIRKLTPRETFNVQGYPADYILPSDIADGQLYKQAGNSVVVPLINRIAKEITDALEFINGESEDYILRNETVTYTNMFGGNIGESYVIRNSNKKELIQQRTNEDLIPLITTDQYKKVIKQRKWKQFYMMNE